MIRKRPIKNKHIRLVPKLLFQFCWRLHRQSGEYHAKLTLRWCKETPLIFMIEQHNYLPHGIGRFRLDTNQSSIPGLEFLNGSFAVRFEVLPVALVNMIVSTDMSQQTHRWPQPNEMSFNCICLEGIIKPSNFLVYSLLVHDKSINVESCFPDISMLHLTSFLLSWKFSWSTQ